jgi:hypothetical protein
MHLIKEALKPSNVVDNVKEDTLFYIIGCIILFEIGLKE